MFDDYKCEDQLTLFDDDGSLNYDEYFIDDDFGMNYEDYLNELEIKNKEFM